MSLFYLKKRHKTLLYSVNIVFYGDKYMSQDRLIKIKCTETGDQIWTRKNKKTTEGKLELKKYNPKLRKHTVWKEMKK